MKKIFIALLAVLLIAAPVYAKGKPFTPSTCTIDSTEWIVTGIDLPVGELLNFFVLVDGAMVDGSRVLGFTDTGTWPVEVRPTNVETTYQFGSKTWGNNGAKWTVFSTCTYNP